MKSIQVLLCLLLISTSLSLKITIQQPQKASSSFRSLYSSLSRRWEIWMSGFPLEPTSGMSGTLTADNITDIVDQLATLSRYIVENVKNDDATFIHFFGSPKYYQNVMDVFSRLADIRTGAVGEEEELHIITNMDVHRTGPGGNEEIATFSFQELVPTITLFSPFRDLDDIFRKGPGHNEVGQLVYLRQSRQAQLWHELIHFITNRIHYPPIAPKYIRSVKFLGSAAVDVLLADACGRGEKKWIFEKSGIVFDSKEALERAPVYGEFRTLILAQLKKGPRYAVHNADSYAMFAIALLVNWNLNGAIMPQRGEPVFWLKTAVRRDPFAQLPPIFDIPGEWRYKYFWGRTGRNVGIVSDDDD